MSTSNDMPAPASAVGSTPTRADGVAASRSTVDIELVCVKGERNSNRSLKSWASREMMEREASVITIKIALVGIDVRAKRYWEKKHF